MKNTRSVFLALLSLSVVLVLGTGCYRPAAPDLTPIPAEGEEAATPAESDLQATAIANSTRAAQTVAAQTAEAPSEEQEGDEPSEGDGGPAATATSAVVAATATAPTSPVQPPPTREPEAPSEPSREGTTTHVVQVGDTLYSIAIRYGTSVDAIARANGLADATQIYAGQELTIPLTGEQAEEPAPPSGGGTTYVVQPGDRLFRIALRYDMSWTRLAEYNGIVNPDSIYPGQVLQIPPQ